MISSGLPLNGTSDAFLGEVPASPPVSLSLQLTPKMAPGGLPWTITLRSKAGIVEADRAPLRRAANKQGKVEFAGLLPGPYQVAIGSGKSSYLTEDINAVEDSILSLDVPVSEIKGTVYRADQPVAGARVLLFAGLDDSVEFLSADDGSFGGTMRSPFFGKLMATVEAKEGWEAFTEVKDVDPSISPIEVNLKFGDASISGIVIDPEGHPQPRAAVILSLQGAPRLSTESDRNGRFRFEALEQAAYEIYARVRPKPPSEAIGVTIESENQETKDVVVTMPRSRSLRVLTEAIDGQPLRGSRVYSYFSGLRNSIGSNGLNSIVPLNGGFDLELPERARTGMFLVRGPGHPLWAGCRVVTAPEGQLPEIRLVAPPPPGGVIRIESVPEAKRPTVGGSLVLLSESGAALPLGTAIATSMHSGEKKIEVTTPLAPGRYAYLQVPMTFAEYASGLCEGTVAIPTDAEWFAVEAGGETVITRPPARLPRSPW